MKYRIFKALFLVSVILTVATVQMSQVYSDGINTDEKIVYVERKPDDYSSYIPSINNRGVKKAASINEEIEEYVYQEVKKFSERIDISSYNLPYTNDNVDLVGDVITNIRNKHPDAYYLSLHYRYSYRTISGQSTIVAIIPEYTTKDKIEVAETIEKINERVNCALARIDDSMTDMEKSLVLHNWIAENCTYDYTYSKFLAKDMFIDGTSVCNGYTSAYYYLLNKIGIPVGFTVSESMNHIWNVVYLDGSWYNVDVTWDDFGPAPSSIEYRYFLKSSDYFENSDVPNSQHYEFENYDLCASTKYDDYYLNSVSTDICIKDDTWYYIKRTGEIIARNKNNQKETVINNISDYWKCRSSSGSYYVDKFYGIDLLYDKIYISISNKVYSMDLNGNNKTTFYTYNNDQYDIYGLKCENNSIILYLTSAPSKTSVYTKSIPLPKNIKIENSTVNKEKEIVVMISTNQNIKSNILVVSYDKNKTMIEKYNYSTMLYFGDNKITINKDKYINSAYSIKILVLDNSDSLMPLCKNLVL